ncbi:MAG: hypothetical protein EA353_03520 [Puniceicoccaceae bacterium]|nr:MAG: hypothetical protein EA353_03520 [Puniceicoccaceae bacterium]
MHSDQRLDTLNQPQRSGGDYYWEIELPNGDYNVSIAGGDPSFDDSFIEFVAEAGTANAVTLVSGDAVGVNFVSGSAQLPYVRVTADHLEFTLQRQEAEITYVIQKSTNLIDWEDYETVTDAHGSVGGEAMLTVPLSEMHNGKLFLRLRVEI